MRFMAKLAIGENAYAELRNANAVRKYWDLFGAVGGGSYLATMHKQKANLFACLVSVFNRQTIQPCFAA